MVRLFTKNATGVAPDGRWYAGDVNAFQDVVAALTDLTQTVSVGTLEFGETGLVLKRYAAGEARISGALRTDGILRGLGGLYAGAFTTTQRNALSLPPYGLVITNTTTNRHEWNSGTPSVPDWQPVGVGLDSPGFTGTPTAPTPLTGDNSTKIATTAFVKAQAYATLASPTFTGNPLAPTPGTGDDSTKIATTEYVQNQGYSTLASPTFTGTPRSTTPGTSDNGTRIATTAFVKAQAYATLDSPDLTGTPTAPTPLTASNSTSIATTAFVKAQSYLTTAAAAATYAPLTSPTFSGIITAKDMHLIDTLAGVPAMRMVVSDGATDEKLWRQYLNGATLKYEIADDANATFVAWMNVVRSGMTVTSVNFPNGLLEYAGHEVAIRSNPVFTGIAQATVYQANAASPRIEWYVTGAAADTKFWDIVGAATTLSFRTRTDADGAGVTWLSVSRSGTSVSTVNVLNGNLQNKGMTVQRHPYSGDRHMESGSTGTLSTGGTTSKTSVFTDPFASAPIVAPNNGNGVTVYASAVSTTAVTLSIWTASSGSADGNWIAEGAD